MIAGIALLLSPWYLAFVAESTLQAVLGWILGLPLGFLLSWGLARLTLTIMELEIATMFDPLTALVVLVVVMILWPGVVTYLPNSMM